MQLLSFSVKNYRSITSAHKINTGDLTVLVGKNNEGKSNILRGLTLAMRLMSEYAENPNKLRRNMYYGRTKPYNWEEDFPIQLQGRNKSIETIFDLEFSLSDQELIDFKKETGIKLTKVIPLRISIGKTSTNIDVPKRGSSAFKTRSQRISLFVCSKIYFNLIPAVRTENDALAVMETIIASELSKLDDNPKYSEAMHIIAELQKEELERISNSIQVPLQQFLPTIKKVSILIPDEKRRVSLRRDIRVEIDDGTPTDIRSKGDGIKNLTALAMLNLDRRIDYTSVIAIEEPESHLHPAAMHELYQTIVEISKKNQVILTTHSPLFVNREELRNNIIVDKGKAVPAKQIKDIRETLGILVSDNLTNASFILIVEGEFDKIALTKILPSISERIKKALKNNVLVIDSLNGASNLSYLLSLYRNMQCKCHVLLDDDDEGRNACSKAQKSKLLSDSEVTFTKCGGSPYAELEDCLAVEAYKQGILDEFGVDVDVKQFRGNKKWSERVASCFTAQGKQWTEETKSSVKKVVSHSLCDDADKVLNQHKRGFIDNLVSSLERMMQSK